MLAINGTFLFAVISFLIFLFIIKAILFHPITKVIEEREKFYAKNLKTEFDSKEKSKALLEEKERLLSEARKEASNILSETNETAKKQSEEILKEVKAQTIDKIEQNQNELNEETKMAKIEIKNEVTNIVGSIISKVLKTDVEINLEEEKINQYLKI
ncbi:MAG: F0F1 ATP synthase subunit B [Candidatus Gastranaerophilales bacterium]|nr:F0F1 ATP synthase subunit B [Candidatus Gastranaerophilales bacterium]